MVDYEIEFSDECYPHGNARDAKLIMNKKQLKK